MYVDYLLRLWYRRYIGLNKLLNLISPFYFFYKSGHRKFGITRMASIILLLDRAVGQVPCSPAYPSGRCRLWLYTEDGDLGTAPSGPPGPIMEQCFYLRGAFRDYPSQSCRGERQYSEFIS